MLDILKWIGLIGSAAALTGIVVVALRSSMGKGSGQAKYTPLVIAFLASAVLSGGAATIQAFQSPVESIGKETLGVVSETIENRKTSPFSE